jgi:hypothetical protein
MEKMIWTDNPDFEEVRVKFPDGKFVEIPSTKTVYPEGWAEKFGLAPVMTWGRSGFRPSWNGDAAKEFAETENLENALRCAYLDAMDHDSNGNPQVAAYCRKNLAPREEPCVNTQYRYDDGVAEKPAKAPASEPHTKYDFRDASYGGGYFD